MKFDAKGADILVYQDEGMSGYYSDRPQYMQMLRDIAEGKIKAVVCYKFDRISRKTLDLLNLVEQLRVKKIAFISCTDEVDTSSRTGKIVMSLLASIAEFERDIIAERIADNMHELAKEGRWLGGTTPLGFYSKKDRLNTGGKKTTVNHLEPVEEEQRVVREMFGVFLEQRSLGKVARWAAGKQIVTRLGKAHTCTSIKNILQNPVYAVADGDTYEYFKAFDVPIYAERGDFDGTHGLMVYNKTEQMKEQREDSTAIRPEYVQQSRRREISDWIISTGEHKGIVSGREWIRAQSVLQDNRAKIKRPKEDTQALLSGLIYCPLCDKNMYTHRESGRYTAGRPRFLYKCKTHKYDATSCHYGDVKGNALDQFVLDAICKMSDPQSDYYQKLMNSELALQAKASDTNSELQQQKQIAERLRREIEGQTMNLRLAPDAAKMLLLEDLERLAKQMAACQTRQRELQDAKQEKFQNTVSFEKARGIILAFPRLLEALSYQNKLELVHKIVARVYVSENLEGDDEVHIFLKGSPDEDYANFLPGRTLCHQRV